MKKIMLLVTLTLLVTVTQAQTNAQEKIEALNKEMEKSFADNNMLKIASFYLDSAEINSGSGRMNITGRNSIDRYWMSMKDRGVSWKIEIDLIEDFDKYVLQRGRSYVKTKGADGLIRESNVRFFLVWIRVEDSYKIITDIFTRL